jgi:hypothetical protein
MVHAFMYREIALRAAHDDPLDDPLIDVVLCRDRSQRKSPLTPPLVDLSPKSRGDFRIPVHLLAHGRWFRYRVVPALWGQPDVCLLTV